MAQLHSLASASVPPAAPAAPAFATSPVSSMLPRSQLRSEAAYEALLPEISAVTAARLLPVNVDVMTAIIRVSDALPGLFALCSDADAPASAPRAMERAELRVEQLEQLEQYGLALGHAHLLYCGSFSPEINITLLAAELSKIRDDMLAHAEALAVAGLLDGRRLQRIARHGAPRALAGDVLALCAAFKDHWPQLEDKTPYTLQEQYRLVRLALDLLAALGVPEPSSGSAGASRRIRQQAFTLFAGAYERARAAVQQLRSAAGDADTLAPPLCTAHSCQRCSEPQSEPECEPAPITLVSGAATAARG